MKSEIFASNMDWFVTFFSLEWLIKTYLPFFQTSLRLSEGDCGLFLGLIFAPYSYIFSPVENMFLTRDDPLYTNHAVFVSNHGRLDTAPRCPQRLIRSFLGAILEASEMQGDFRCQKHPSAVGD
jgi:hypothetical protein